MVTQQLILDHEAERGAVFCGALWGFGSSAHPGFFWNGLLAAGLGDLPS